MKSSIRVIKHKDGRSVNPETPENQKAAEPNDRKIASTVKSWIAELQQRKRSHSHSFTVLTVLILMMFAVALGQTPASTLVRKLTPDEQGIKVTSEVP